MGNEVVEVRYTVYLFLQKSDLIVYLILSERNYSYLHAAGRAFPVSDGAYWI